MLKKHCPNHPDQILELIEKGTKVERFECPVCCFNIPQNFKVIDKFYCWLSVDEEGREGMIALNMNGVMMVAQHSEKEMSLRLSSLVRQAADSTNQKLILAEFERKRTIQTINPPPKRK